MIAKLCSAKKDARGKRRISAKLSYN
jgi:hypothetical protein